MDTAKLDGLLREVIAGFEEDATEDVRAVARRAAKALADALVDGSDEPQLAAHDEPATDVLDKAIQVMTQLVEAKKAAEQNAPQPSSVGPVVPRIPRRLGG